MTADIEITADTNDQLMAMAAHRYCLGRQSYIVGACIEWIQGHWTQFTGNTQSIMLGDTIEAIKKGIAGMDVDERGWRDLAEWMWAQMGPKQREGLCGMVTVAHGWRSTGVPIWVRMGEDI